MRVALIRQVFLDCPPMSAEELLYAMLTRARNGGAEIAVLPELPLLPWRPAFEEAVDSDAEQMRGRTFTVLSDAARRHGMGVLGGAIVRDEAGTRHGTAMLFDARGELVLKYRKLHLPSEPGFWEDRHYVPGDEPPSVCNAFSMPVGVQLCSDINRPEGSHMLAAMGAQVLLCPRATEAGTFDRWRLMLRANAVAGCCYVLSVTRPRPEFGVPLGGPSIVIAPDGEVLEESEDDVLFADLSTEVVGRARTAYPGYLALRPEVYAKGWEAARSAIRPA